MSKDWLSVSPMPVAKLESCSCVLDQKLYTFGGFKFRLKATPRVDVYDLETDTWSRTADMPRPVTHFKPIVDGRYIWIAGGFVGDHPGWVTDEVWRYDVDNNIWEAQPSLPQVRASGGFEIVGRSLHYFGGFGADRDTNCSEHWVLDLDANDGWTLLSHLPEARGHFSSVFLDNKIYALGGQYRHDTNPVDLALVHVYDLKTREWKELESMPSPRSHFEPGTFVYDGKIFVSGGRNNHKKRQDSLNPFSDRGNRYIDDIPMRIYLGISKRHNIDYLYDDIIVFDPQKNCWEPLGVLPAHLLAPVANVVKKTVILTSGGKNWVYNPTSRTFLNETLLDLVKR